MEIRSGIETSFFFLALPPRGEKGINKEKTVRVLEIDTTGGRKKKKKPRFPGGEWEGL